MLKIKKKRLENLLGNRLLAPLKTRLRALAHNGQQRRMRDAFASLPPEPAAFFHQIQVETCSFCNNDCHFCPASTAVDPRPKSFMSWETIHELVAQLKSIRFNGLVSLFNNNDPLIDKRLPGIIRYFRGELPETRIEIYTNGILLNMDTAAELWEAGLDSLMVDHYYTSKERNRKIEKFIKDFKRSGYAETRTVTVNEINKEIIRSSRGGEMVHQQDNNQIVIPGYINNGQRVDFREPVRVYKI